MPLEFISWMSESVFEKGFIDIQLRTFRSV